MPFKYTEKAIPLLLAPESLDYHLAQGWYRMGGFIFTTHFLFFREQPYSAIWIRLGLEGHAFSKSQRKLMRRNAKLFDIAVHPIAIRREHEELYQRYAADFDGILSPTIRDSLEHYDEEGTMYNTWMTEIREKNSRRLVGYSFFDLGAEASSSISGIFDPLLSSFSLGYYTMLLEIQYSVENGLGYYYPGYVVPGYERFDYKLRIGSCDYLRVDTMDWEAFDWERVRTTAPVEVQRQKLEEVAGTLGKGGFPFHGPRIYPLFEAPLYDILTEDYFPYPLLIPLLKVGGDFWLVLAFDPQTRQYFVCSCAHMTQRQSFFDAGYLNGFSPDRYFTELLSINEILLQTADGQVAAAACLRLLTTNFD